MPKFKENTSAFMMKGKSPMMKALIGKQKNLPEELKEKILASPAQKYVSDAQRKAVHASKAEKSPARKNYPYPTKRMGNVNPNSEGNTDTKEGRSKSSMAQKRVAKAEAPFMKYGKSMAKKYGKKSMAKNYKKGYYGA
jgi:hypothetical protein